MSSYFLTIPMDVADCSDLSDSDCMFYARLTGLTVKYGYCSAGNEYLADKFNISQRVVSRRISALARNDFIRVEETRTQEGTERKIWLSCAAKAPSPRPTTKPKAPKPKQPKPLSKLTVYPDQLNYEAWISWLEYKRDEHSFKFKTEKTELTSINKLIKDTNGNQQLQADWIENSIANGYKGIFGGRNVNSNNAGVDQAGYFDQLNERVF